MCSGNSTKCSDHFEVQILERDQVIWGGRGGSEASGNDSHMQLICSL